MEPFWTQDANIPGDVRRAFAQECRKAVDVCNRLIDEDKRKLPETLIMAFEAYAKEAGDDCRETVHADLDDVNGVFSSLMQLILYYCGEESRRRTISWIQENTKPHERQMIEEILKIKKELEDKQTGGIL